MPYRFTIDDPSVAAGVRRIAGEQVAKAIGELDDDAIGLHDTVHQVRKRCKKVRGLVRLVRPAMPDYKVANAAFRDAARGLSFLRDSEALIGVYDTLVDRYDDQLDRPAFASVRRRLTLRRNAAAEAEATEKALADFRAAMVAAQDAIAAWTLTEDGFDAVAGGLGKTYKRGRKAMARGEAERTPEALHDWRKRTKYHWYHARLLSPVWLKPMKAHRKAADRLSDLLGDHHDLAVFRQTVQADPDAFGSAADLDVLLGVAGRRQRALEGEAFALGARLYAEPAPALAARWAGYWEAWRADRAA
jgi:CHAD domain-containing protein